MRVRIYSVLLFWLVSLVGIREASSRPSLDITHQPLSFELNQGQTDPEAKYLARGNGYMLFLTSRDAVLRLKNGGSDPDSVLRMRWLAAHPAPALSHEQQLPGRVNYLRGSDRAKWLTDLKTYGKVRLAQVYDGIDLAFFGNQHKFEYDFEVAPGADPKRIALAFEGASGVTLDANGDLIVKVGDAELRQHKPIVYQLI